jgi:hypothetical protein
MLTAFAVPLVWARDDGRLGRSVERNGSTQSILWTANFNLGPQGAVAAKPLHSNCGI